MRNSFRLYALSVVLLLLSGCNRNPFDVDLKEKLAVTVNRFDLAFDSLRNGSLEEQLPAFIEAHRQWLPLYCNQVIRVGDVYSAQLPAQIRSFFAFPEYEAVASVISEKFPNDSALSQSLSDAFSHYHYYFPEKRIPAIYTFNGGFNQSIVVADSVIAVGLDKYLGADSKFYYQLGIDRYKIEKMTPERIPFDVVSAHILSEHENTFMGGTLLAEIIHQGRCMYLLNACFPQEADTLLWGVSNEKMQWLHASERSMWEYLVEKKQLFETKYMTIQKFTGEGPFTAPFSKESPARAAVWVGYRIVKGFMENEPSFSMEQLFALNDCQFVLSRSKYNP